MAGIWRKTMVYLGLAEDEYEEEYPDDYEPEEPEPSPVRRLSEAGSRSSSNDAVVRAMPTAPSARFHLLRPSSFNDAQELGDKYREGYSVIMNLQGAQPELAQRIIDFASGLAYGLGGSMKPVAEKVFLVTPEGVQVSAEERRRFLEERGFFNQA
ncbi:MAG TPA: cell division protein SepF [Actinomycetota bacterium]|nr:cell division protein SepF [Actinomycetota bacterium]